MAATSETFSFSAPDIAAEMDRTGFVRLEGAVSEEWLERARAHVRGLLDKHGERFFSITRPGDEPGSPAEEMANDPKLHALMDELTLEACPHGIDREKSVYNVMRIIAGKEAEKGSLLFHYDASVVTALVPIFMPDMGHMKSGELVTFANRRPFRRSVGRNLLEKMLSQNRWARRRANTAFARDPQGHIQLLYPGSIYLFWGYRTYHGNLPCAPGSLRATMLLHYGNPHGNSLPLRTLRFGRQLFEAVRLRLS